MRPSIDRPLLEEPWAKRLRITRSRSVKAQERRASDHLPSPKPTNPSSTDNVSSSSSSVDHKAHQTQNTAQSLRERLAPLPKKPTPLSPVKNVAVKKPPSKPSVAPFFRRIEAAFQDKPATSTKLNHTPTAAQASARSPSPSADDLIQQLKEHYLQTATTLHKSATLRLAQTHADLTRQLTQSLSTNGAADAAFLDETEARIKKLAQPLDTFRIRSQQRGADGALRAEEDSVGDLVARAEDQVRGFETEVAGLWAEWAAAEGEVKELLKGVAGCVSGSGPGSGSGGGEGGGEEGVGGVDGDDEGEVMVKRFREAIEREIVEAEEEVVEIGEEAVGVMKDIEKVSWGTGSRGCWLLTREQDFRKATLPDLHTFFQSIDEP
ncbi:uncharacterized protein B0H64DRAFT_110071 [Chaetomium fimeti]|uniref:Uncharacterized protein n=1 Tax=Chaetomium fimeti TaxID=1854472 RepID=A0AAE0HHT2_9PEZI|nr:hypothetical protein B0H64DRAFT_110071 [Chaetomium fimeti]